MNILTKNNIKLNWDLVDYGLRKGWLSPEQVADAAFNKFFSERIAEELIVQLEIKKEDREEFTDFIHALSSSDNSDIVIDIWELVFLLEIIKTGRTREEKLQNVEVLWADFNYPEKWAPFIYYLPSNNEVEGTDYLFESLVNYINEEKARLGIE